MISENKQAVLDFFERLWNQGELDVAPSVLTEDFAFSNPPNEMYGPENFQKFVQFLRSCLDQLNFDLRDVVEEGDVIAVRWLLTGIHVGEMLGYPATHRRVEMNGCDFCHMDAGKIKAMYASMDMLGLTRQFQAKDS